jgi:hypothetical protein
MGNPLIVPGDRSLRIAKTNGLVAIDTLTRFSLGRFYYVIEGFEPCVLRFALDVAQRYADTPSRDCNRTRVWGATRT